EHTLRHVHLRPEETCRVALERHRRRRHRPRRLHIERFALRKAPARSLERAGDGTRPEERVEGAVLRLLPLLTPVVVAGSAVLGVALRAFGDSGPSGRSILGVLAGSVAFSCVNILLVTAVIARWAREPFGLLLGRTTRATTLPFAIMASVSLMLVVMWERSPFLSAALVGPLLAIVLYQRSVHRALAAMRLALTDPLTGLGNHRHFHERLEVELDRAETRREPLSLCLIDLDDFKRINDSFGHPIGDQVLCEVADCLRHGGEAFRLGGDEFALLLHGLGETEALAIAETVVARLAALDHDTGRGVCFSAGVATFPIVPRSDLRRLADAALYRAKGEGKNGVHAYRPDPEAPLHALGRSGQ